MSCILRKFGVGTTINFPLINYGTSDFLTSTPTISAGDTQVSKDDGAFTNIASNSGLFVWLGNGQAYCSLSATELQAKQVIVTIIDTSPVKAWEDQAVLIETYGTSAAQHPFDLGTATQSVNVIQIDGVNLSAHASGMVPCDLRDISGVSLTTSAAQIGVNLVSIEGTSPLSAATLNLKKLRIINNAGDAVVFSATGSNGNGLVCQGNGTGSGIAATGGSTGVGMGLTGGSSSGDGLNIFSNSGAGINVAVGLGAVGNGHALQLLGSSTGNGMNICAGINGTGIKVLGGATTGDAVNLSCPGTAGNAIAALGAASSAGIIISGGLSGIGLDLVGGAGAPGMRVTGGTDAAGLSVIGTGTGAGILCTGGSTGHGISSIGGIGGHGMLLTGGSVANGLRATGGLEGAYFLGTGNKSGVVFHGGTTGSGAQIISGVSGGTGLTISAQSGNTNGVSISGSGSGSGINSAGGSSGIGLSLVGGGSAKDVAAKEIDSIVAKLPVTGLMSNISYADIVDNTGVTPATLSDIFKYVLCMTNGRFVRDLPNPGDVTFYARDNTTILFTVHIDTTQRTRSSPL